MTLSLSALINTATGNHINLVSQTLSEADEPDQNVARPMKILNKTVIFIVKSVLILDLKMSIFCAAGLVLYAYHRWA